jgi:hypothetical protein
MAAESGKRKRKRKGNAKGVFKGARQTTCSAELRQGYLVTI